MRISKVRRTDFRNASPASDPPGAGGNRPLERTPRPGAAACPPVWDRMNDSTKREMAEHDRNIAGMSMETHVAAFKDLRRRGASNRKDPVERWEMSRKAAHLRVILAHEEAKKLSPARG